MVMVDILEIQTSFNPHELFEKIGFLFGEVERLKIFIEEQREIFNKMIKKKE